MAISELHCFPLCLKNLCLLCQKMGGRWGLDAEMAQGLFLNHCGSSHEVAVEVAEPVLTLASWSPWGGTWDGHWMETKT